MSVDPDIDRKVIEFIGVWVAGVGAANCLFEGIIIHVIPDLAEFVLDFLEEGLSSVSIDSAFDRIEIIALDAAVVGLECGCAGQVAGCGD